mgnify:CR=1 FL=1
MARITSEKAVLAVENIFDLVLIASQLDPEWTYDWSIIEHKE